LGPYLGLQRSATARADTDAVLTGHTMRDFGDLLRPEGLDELLGGGSGRPDPGDRSGNPLYGDAAVLR